MPSVVVWKEARQDMSNTHTVLFSTGCDVTLHWAYPTICHVLTGLPVCVYSVVYPKGWMGKTISQPLTYVLGTERILPLYFREAP